MNDPLDDTLRRHYEKFASDHEPMRERMLAGLEQTDSPANSEQGRRLGVWRLARKLKLAAAAAVVVAAVGLFLYLTPSPAAASQAFADVLAHVRAASAVTYSLTLTVPGAGVQTARVRCTADGRERKVFSNGAVQISDYTSGSILYHAPPNEGWTLQLDCPGSAFDGAATPLQRLATLPETVGRPMGIRRIDGRDLHGYDVVDSGQRMMIWADEHARPVRIEIASASAAGLTGPEATLTMEEFDWNGSAVPAPQPPPNARGPRRRYVLTMIDPTTRIGEPDLAAMLRLLAERSGGVYPDSIEPDAPGITSSLTAGAAVNVMDLATGCVVIAGTAHAAGGGEDPAMVRMLRDRIAAQQIQRGQRLIHQLARKGRPFRYVGAGVRQGESRRIFWFKPEGADSYRVLYADGTVRDVAAKHTPADHETP